MKEKLLNFTFCLFCFFSLFLIFKNNKEVTNIIINALNLFFKRVFPSLFPMFILNDFFQNLNLPFYFYLIFNKPFTKIFNISGIGCYLFIMSLLSGSPTQACIIKNLVNTNQITIKEANHFLMFTYFSSPLFLITMLSLMFSFKVSLKIILIHYLSNIIILFLIRKKAPKTNSKPLKITKKIPLSESINKSISTLLMILGTITFYMLLTFIITSIFNVSYLKPFIAGMMEITSGLNTLATLKINSKIKEIIAISFISFGGLSINSQIKAILEDTNINYFYFLKGRIYQTIISVILCFIF